MTLGVLIGAGIGALVGLVLANWLDRRARRRMYEQLARKYPK